MDADVRTRLESRILTALDEAGRDVMQWGRDDCALWCANIVRDVLGYDPAAAFRGRYKSRIGALRVLGRGGLKRAITNAARRHKWKRINPEVARPGDVGLAWTTVNTKRGPVPTLATVICRTRDWFVGRNEKGFTAIPAHLIVCAWSVLDDRTPGTRVGMARLPARPSLIQTSAAAHEPVSTVIGLTALITGLGVSASVAGAIGGFLVTSVLGIGFSLASSLLQPQTGLGALDSNLSSSTAQAVQITERQSLPYKRVILGNAYVGGALFFEQVRAPYLYQGILISEGPIDGIESVTLGTNALTFHEITPDSIMAPLPVVGQPDYASHVLVSLRYGSSSQSLDPLLASDFTSPAIDTNYRQKGIATAVLRYGYGANSDEYIALWGQVPRPTAYFEARGVRVYDPRDPTQILDDETTWKFSNNASLVQAYYLTRDWGGRISKSDILWDKVASSADYDDELVGCKDGSFIKRHTIDGVIVCNQSPSAVLPKLLTANRGYVLESAGKMWVASSRPKDPIATIHDGIIAGAFTYKAAKAKRDLINKLQVRFIATEQEYQVVDGPILSRTDLQAIDKEILPGTLALDFTRDHRRAQRLQKAFLDSSRLGRTITVPVDITLLSLLQQELIGEVVRVDSRLWTSINGTYLVTGVGFTEDMSTLSLALTEYDKTIESDWTPATDEKDFSLDNPLSDTL